MATQRSLLKAELGRKEKLNPLRALEALKRVEAGEPLREVALSLLITRRRLKARHV